MSKLLHHIAIVWIRLLLGKSHFDQVTTNCVFSKYTQPAHWRRYNPSDKGIYRKPRNFSGKNISRPYTTSATNSWQLMFANSVKQILCKENSNRFLEINFRDYITTIYLSRKTAQPQVAPVCTSLHQFAPVCTSLHQGYCIASTVINIIIIILHTHYITSDYSCNHYLLVSYYVWHHIRPETRYLNYYVLSIMLRNLT